MLRKIGNRWVLVSKKTLRPLAYYKGEDKPPDSWVAEQEARIESFKEEYKSVVPKSGAGEEGTDELIDTFLKVTPGQPLKIKNFKDFRRGE